MRKTMVLAVMLLGAIGAYAQEYELTFIAQQTDVAAEGTTCGTTVVCSSINACTLPDPADPTQNQPAISFDVPFDAVVHIEANVYDGLGCGTLLQSVAGDLQLMAGHDIVYLNFQPPLPAGTQLSLNWNNVGGCMSTACSNYTIGSSPPICQ